VDAAALIQLITAALGTQPFQISGAQLQSPAVTTLLTAHLGTDALTLSGAAAAGQTPAGITVTGTMTTAIYGLSGLLASAEFSVANGAAQLTMTLTGLPAGWQPSASFPALGRTITDAFSYADISLVLDSLNAEALPPAFPACYGYLPFSAATTAALVRGLSVRAAISLANPPAELVPLLGTTAWPVAGEIALLPDAASTALISTSGSDPLSVGGYQFPFTLAVVVAALQPADASLPLASASVLQFQADITRNVAAANDPPHLIDLPIVLQTIPADATVLTAATNLPLQAPLTLTELAQLITGQSLADLAPSTGGFPSLQDLTLNDVSVTFMTSPSVALLRVAVTVGLAPNTRGSWSILDGLITFSGMSVTFAYVTSEGGLEAFAEAEATLAGGDLDASISLPDLVCSLTLDSGTIDIKEIIDYIAGSSVDMPAITCSGLDISADVPNASYQFQAVITDDWSLPIGETELALTQMWLDLGYADSALAGEIGGEFSIAGQTLTVSADYKAGSWSLAAGTTVPISLSLDDLATGLATELGLNFSPDVAPAGLTLGNLNAFYNTGTKDLKIKGYAPFTVAGTQCGIGLAVEYVQGATTFSGYLFLGDEAFEITFSAGDATTLTGSWSPDKAGDVLDITDVITALGGARPAVPSDLDVGLSSASFSYDITTGTLLIEAASASYGKAVFVATPVNGGGTEYFFGISAGAIDLAGVPVVGDALAAVLSISDVTVVLSSSAMTAEVATAVNALITAGYPAAPADGTADVIALAVTASVAGLPISLSIGLSEPASSGDNTTAPVLPQDAPVTTTTPAQGDGATWVNVQRTIGPLTLQRLGIQYAGGALWLGIDAALSVGGLAVTLDGLSVSSTLDKFAPAIGLEGLSIALAEPPLAIGAAFEQVVPPPNGMTWDYAGGGVVAVPGFGLLAIGSYGQLDGKPSMFIFARLNGELGGPAFFFVTGLAAGFGYNSAVRIPTQDQVISFPLVAGAASATALGSGTADPVAALDAINEAAEWITPSLGSIWIAAGVSFTSFELIYSQALMIAEFGNDLCFALLGLSTARFPQAGPVTYAEVQLELEVVVDVGAGSFEAAAVLSPNSYLLDPACLLTGGFAFCFWFGDNAHAGDFVLTIGGYSPYFTAPSWYPAEPRVGFSWSISSLVTVSGDVYFALTPAAIMAGGALSVAFHDGSLSAWYTAHLDVIAWWQPFAFTADIGVSIGASYRVELVFTSKTLTAELGAQVELWGPPTGGTATVHAWIISFTVDFGTPAGELPEPMDWTAFQQLLPASPIQLTAVSGVISQEVVDGVQTWIVRAGSFAFTATTAVPADSITVAGGAPMTSAALDILPMQVTGASSALTVSLTAGDGQACDACTAAALTASGPAALWGNGPGTGVPAAGSQLVPGLLTGTTVQLQAPVIGPTPGVVDVGPALSYTTLDLSSAPPVPVTAGAAATGPAPQASGTTIADIASGIAAAGVSQARAALYAELAVLGYTLPGNAAMTGLAASAGALYSDEPMEVSAT
jgi:hypothetical protein